MTKNAKIQTTTIIMQRARLWNSLRAVDLYASQDFTRPHLAGILFDFHEKRGLRLVATDGHRMCYATPCEVKHIGANRKLLMGAEQVAMLIKVVKCLKAEREDAVTILADEAGLTISFGTQTVTLPASDAIFPKHWEETVPEPADFTPYGNLDNLKPEDLREAAEQLKKQQAVQIGFNPRYLSECGIAVQFFGATVIKIDAIVDERSPARMDAYGPECGEITIVLMPHRF